VVQHMLEPMSLLGISVCTFVLNLSVLPSIGNTKNKEIAPSRTVSWTGPSWTVISRAEYAN
jgi:hypothetical protein